MWLPCATACHVRRSRVVEALSSVRAASHDMTVVVVLAVVLPPALSTDVIGAALVQRAMSATWARIRPVPRSEDVELSRVGVEPGLPLRDLFLVAHHAIVAAAGEVAAWIWQWEGPAPDGRGGAFELDDERHLRAEVAQGAAQS